MESRYYHVMDTNGFEYIILAHNGGNAQLVLLNAYPNKKIKEVSQISCEEFMQCWGTHNIPGKLQRLMLNEIRKMEEEGEELIIWSED